jgi:hypothetical protein
MKERVVLKIGVTTFIANSEIDTLDKGEGKHKGHYRAKECVKTNFFNEVHFKEPILVEKETKYPTNKNLLATTTTIKE